MMVIDIDADLRNADWLRTMVWDILPIEGETELQAFLGAVGIDDPAEEGAKEKVNEFMALPAAEAMPATLRDELEILGLL
jgi:hypothetical protein